MNIPDYIFKSLETTFWYKILKFFDEDVDQDPGLGNLFDLGFWVWDGKIEMRDQGINIPDKAKKKGRSK
jgi:hypothetical protein